jgi:NADPH2:quinone reductase
MESIIVTGFGGPEMLQLQEVPVPEPKANQALIKVKTAGINFADIMQRKGLYPGGPNPPFGAGFEVAGVIEKAGLNAAPWRPGDAVMGFCSSGYSEYVTADAAALLAKPGPLDFNRAAAVPCQYLTAYHVLLTLGRLVSGQTILIQAAAGGLGTLLVQIARNVGATVIGTCSSDEKCALLRELGCHHPINYAKQKFHDEVQRITDHKGCDLVVESVGGDVFDKSLRCVRPRGRLITLGAASGKPRSIRALYLLMNNVTVSGFHLFGYAGDAEAMANAVRDLHAWLEAGKLTFVVRHVFPLAQAAAAHRLIEDRKSVGKVVLTVAE